MSHSIESLQKTLAEGLDATHVIVIDETLGGCGAKFMFYICSTKFEGVSLINRNRMVHGVLEEEMKDIHAVSMKTWTPAQWEKKKSQIPAEYLRQIE